MSKMLKITLCLLLLFSNVTSLTLPEKYDSSYRPNQGAVADVVNVSTELLAILGVNEKNSEMTVDISIHTSWVDSRLVELVPKDILFVNQIPSIWLPNVQIANSASKTLSNQVLQLNKDGLVKHSQKLTTSISCPISLAKYPFDRQICKLQLNSYGYNSVHLLLVWHGTVSDQIPTYDSEFSFSYTEQSSENIKTPNGEYSNLYLEIAVSRCPLRVIFRAILPSVLLLILSYYVTFCHCILLRNKTTVTANGNHVEAAVIAQPTTVCSLPMGFNLFLIAINGMIFLVTILVAQINYIESPKSSAVSGLDVWLSFVTAVMFVILWHSVQLYLNDCHKDPDVKNQNRSCVINKTSNILKIGIGVTFIVFVIAYFGIYLS